MNNTYPLCGYANNARLHDQAPDGGLWRRTVDGGRWAADGGQWAVGGGRWVVGGGWWTARRGDDSVGWISLGHVEEGGKCCEAMRCELGCR